MTRLHFVSAPGGSAFMHELLTVVAYEVSELGPESAVEEVTVSEGPLPTGGEDDVYVVAPHEYFVVLPVHLLPGPAQLARTIGFCVEHPGNETFHTTVRYARQLAACVDINDDSTAELNALGLATERFVLGYSKRWDRWRGGETERPHDVVYLGTTDDRRARALALDVDVLRDADVLLAMPPHEPMTKPRPDFFIGDTKLDLLAAAKVLVNLHRGDSRSLEWVRVLEAMCNGCVVVSEHSSDIEPLRPGKHLLLGRPRTLVHLARSVLADPARLAAVRADCYALLRSELTMRPSALALAQLAADVCSGTFPARPRSQARPRPTGWPAQRAGELTIDRESARGRTALRIVRSPWAVSPASRRRQPADVPRDADAIDVTVIRTPGLADVSVALTALLPQLHDVDAVIHLCFDGVDHGELPDDPRLRVYGGTDRTGAGFLLNQVLDASDAAALLVLVAGDQLAHGALKRLWRAIDEHQADAAYGMVVNDQGLLVSALPFEADRLARLDYLATAALWRRSSLVTLGGWSEDPDIDGAETWDLWRRLGASGGSAVLVPRPLVRQAFSQDPPLSRYEFDPVGVGRLLVARGE
jgi:hypothetical protein